jgi:hypothetical protein
MRFIIQIHQYISTDASIKTPFIVLLVSNSWNGIPSCFLFRGMVRNEIPRVLLQFFSTERNSEHFSLPRNGFGTEFRDFCVPRKRRNSVGINQFFRLFRLPRNNFFVGNCQPYSSRIKIRKTFVSVVCRNLITRALVI